MSVYQCAVCGYLLDEEAEGTLLKDLAECPVCKHSKSNFTEVTEKKASSAGKTDRRNELQYDSAYARQDPSCRYMAEIHQMAVEGRSIGAAMGIKSVTPSWDDILILGAQLNPPPLLEEEPGQTETVLGKHAKRPMVLRNPVYISHMSFGALSKEVKVALAKGSAMAKTAMCSGEGGILPEERDAAYKYIFEYV